MLFRTNLLFQPQLHAPAAISHVLTAAATQQNATFWQWVERISWLVIILGLILTLFQLTRLLEEASAHSLLEVGFRSNPLRGPINKSQISSAFRNSPGSYRTTLTFITRNSGNSSARDININYRFPEGIGFPEDENKKIPHAASNEIRPVPIEGTGLIVVSTFDYLHPDAVHIDSFIIDVSRKHSNFEVQVDISRSDSKRLSESLQVTLSPTDSADAAAPTQQVLDALKGEVISGVSGAEDEHVSVANRLRTGRGSGRPH